MHIRNAFLKSVAFLVIDTKRNVREPHGSTFLIELPDDKDRNILWQYFVTARHCIENADTNNIWIRVNKKEHGYEDLLTERDRWFINQDADVAVVPTHLLGQAWQSVQLDISPVSVEYFVNSKYCYVGPFAELGLHHKLANPFLEKGGWPIQVGEYVYFIGLFTEEYGKSRNRPIVRHGIVSRTPDEPIELERDKENKFTQFAYLAESFSWPGHSGSPVIWIWDGVISGYYNPKEDEWYAWRTSPICVWNERHMIIPTGAVQGVLGLVSAHFGKKEKAEITGDIVDKEAGTIETKLNTGIAAVTPAHYIYELLIREDVVADRDQVR